MKALWRLAVWGGLATFALFVAVIAGYSNAGSQRQAASITSGQGTKPPRAAGTESEETGRLAEAVRNLASDRDQVLARIAALERNLDGVTGTIKRERVAGSAQTPSPATSQIPPQVSPPAPQQPPQQAAPQNPANGTPTAAALPVVRLELPAVPVTLAAISPAQAPVSQQSSASETAAPVASDAGNRVAVSALNPVRVTALAEALPAAAGLGIDVGGATNYEGLRTLWQSTKNSDPTLLEELYPLIAVRENSKTHGVDLRLVVGPIADAEAASRLCTALAETHRYCQPVAFEGQRLAMIETSPTKAASTKAAPPPHHGAAVRSSASSPEPFSNVNYPRGK